MSDTKTDLPKEENNGGRDSSEGQVVNALIKRLGNQITIQDPESGKTIIFKAQVVDDEDDADDTEEFRLVPVEEFKAALHTIDRLGLCWTPDLPPSVRPKEGVSGDPLSNPEFLELTKRYPHLPFELDSITKALLTGKVRIGESASNENEFYKKAAIVQALIISPQYKNEFFFKNSIKVPYFSDLDWEVVIKAYERNVEIRPDIVYGLISLSFYKNESHNPWNRTGGRQAITVAVNEKLVDKIINSLTTLKKALQNAHEDLESMQATRKSHASQPE